MISDIQIDVRAIRQFLEDDDGEEERKKYRNLTAEDEARFEETQRMVRERIAYHQQKAREEDARREARERRLRPFRRFAELIRPRASRRA